MTMALPTNMLSITLRELGFERVGCIRLSGDYAAFDIDRDAGTARGCVYVWMVADSSGLREVLYVGKAGNRLIDRCRQHQAGFRSGSAGMGNMNRIRREYSAGRFVLVFARQSPSMQVFGQPVSMCSIEEEALIIKLKPTLNGFKKQKADIVAV